MHPVIPYWTTPHEQFLCIEYIAGLLTTQTPPQEVINLQARIEHSKKEQDKDPDIALYLKDKNMKEAQVTAADVNIVKWETEKLVN